MKIKKRLILILALTACFSTSKTFAQFSGGLELGLPMGNFSDMASTGFGVTAKYEANISDKLNWNAGIGYLSFSGKTFNIFNVSIPFGNTTNIPISGGIKYYFSEVNKGFYGAMDLSFNFLSTYVYTYNNGNGGGYNLSSVSQTNFGLNPGIGYRTGNFDFTGRFNMVGDFSYVGLRAAYVFGGK